MASKDEVIAEFEKGYREFFEKVNALSDAAWDETWLGTWKTEHVLAHMAGWAREMAGGIERVAQGLRPTPDGVNYGDTDGWNAKFSALAKADRKAAVADFEAAFAKYYNAAKALPEEFFGIGENGKPKIGNRLLDGAGIHHFAEHGEELDAWQSGKQA